MEFYFFRLVHAIDHSAGDDSGGITTGHGGVDMETVDVPVLLNKHREHTSQHKLVWLIMLTTDDQLNKDQGARYD